MDQQGNWCDARRLVDKGSTSRTRPRRSGSARLQTPSRAPPAAHWRLRRECGVANLPTAPRIGPYACLRRRASLSVLLLYYILPAPALDATRILVLLHSYQFSHRTMLNSLPSPTNSLSDLAREERSFTFAHFTCEHAWVIGNILRNALRTIDCAALIHISLSSSQTLFHAPSMPGMMPDAEAQVKRKRETVLRWGHSTWFMRCKHGNDKGLAEYYGLDAGAGENGRARYSCEGGGSRVRQRRGGGRWVHCCRSRHR